MKHKLNYLLKLSLACALLISTTHTAFSQIELEPWGNIRGIRIDGQLMEFETNLSVVQKNWASIKATAKEQQRPKYVRKGDQQIVTTNIDSLFFTKTVEEAGRGGVKVDVQFTARRMETIEGVYVALTLPQKYYANGTVQVNTSNPVKLAQPLATLNNYVQAPATSLQFVSKDRQLKLTFKEPTSVIFRNTEDKSAKALQVFIPIQAASAKEGQTIAKSFSMQASGLVDRKPINLVLNTSQTGRPFDGLGGNFRLQNPRTDPQVIDYSLENLNVTWGRVEMPWRFWQPSIDSSPIARAKEGRLAMQVQRAMEMAQRLHKKGMPVILSAWSGPTWAIVGPPRGRPGPDGVWGNPLDHTKDNEIYKSIADYIVYLKDTYGVEISMFSFNESDLGINIRQTGEEHAALIKGLGAHFVSRGLKTKLLLGDNSDATTYEFIYPALNDPSTHQYIGAVSFHSWRGWETEILQKWADAATKIKLPLLVGEGSIDAQAHGYPAIFEEQTYALEEINLYTRILAICQPASILQWQLTADYSPLAGGGIFGDNRPLQPTRRFWNLKQLSSTPKGLKAMPLKSDGVYVAAAALGDNTKGTYAIHLVNNGTTRQVNLSGLPKNLKTLNVYVTDKKRSAAKANAIKVTGGKATFTLDETSYTTLMTQ